ncbi:hypothetical protein Ocin01_00516 [Orchesella cincta]|uniref:Uncharacterized protein n=1 Tax=Orchesella cincta TaxID=48709 RepID=A0A1D2NLK3_ORCCI|nr:hypothetical protein Ocin01_00516 [Orchesella cincta]
MPVSTIKSECMADSETKLTQVGDSDKQSNNLNETGEEQQGILKEEEQSEDNKSMSLDNFFTINHRSVYEVFGSFQIIVDFMKEFSAGKHDDKLKTND